MIIYERDFEGACIVTARAGTTGLMGGDAGHGGKTIVEIESCGCDIVFIAQDEETNDTIGIFKKIRISANGDSELMNLIESLEWIVKVLRKCIKEKI